MIRRSSRSGAATRLVSPGSGVRCQTGPHRGKQKANAETLSQRKAFNLIADGKSVVVVKLPSVGPVYINPDTNGPTQLPEAYNVGDGALNLTVRATASWLTGSVGTPSACSQGVCNPVSIALNTFALTPATYTGFVVGEMLHCGNPGGGAGLHDGLSGLEESSERNSHTELEGAGQTSTSRDGGAAR